MSSNVILAVGIALTGFLSFYCGFLVGEIRGEKRVAPPPSSSPVCDSSQLESERGKLYEVIAACQRSRVNLENALFAERVKHATPPPRPEP